MEYDPNRMTDGFADAVRGSDSSKPPNLIARNAVAFAINTTFRGGYPFTRDRYLKRPFTFQSPDEQTAFETGNLQGAAYYRPTNGFPFHIVSVSGRIWKVDSDFNVEELTSTDRNAANLDRVWMVQAEQYLVIQDGQSAAFVFDGASLTRSYESSLGIPVGTVMAYGQRRLGVARGRVIFFGDIADGPTNVVTFSENATIDLGGTFTIAFPGPITAMAYLPVLDATTGQGELSVHTPYGVSTLKTYLPRSQWKTTLQFETVAFLPFGGISSDSVVSVNSDLWYRSRDGIRSLTIVIRDNQGSWINSPQSTEMGRVLDKDVPELATFAQSILFNNRLLTTCRPEFHSGRMYFRGIIALDFDLMSSLYEKAPAAYDGLWTGLNITRLIVGDYSGRDRAFAYCIDANGNNTLWELTTEKGEDNDTNRIEASLESASYFFNNPRENKQLEAFEVFLSELAGTVDLNLQYRPDQYPVWIDWRSWSVCAPLDTCNPSSGCLFPTSLNKHQYRSKALVNEPPIQCEPATDKPTNFGYEFQFRLSWKGQMQLRKAFIHTLKTESSPYGSCLADNETCVAVPGCDPDDFSYSIPV